MPDDVAPVELSNSDRLSQLEAFRNASWERFNARRDFEWKVLLGYWGMLLAGCAALLDGKGAGNPTLLMISAGVAAVGAFVLMIVWVTGVKRANDFDRAVGTKYEVEIEKMLGVQPDQFLKDRRQTLLASAERDKPSILPWSEIQLRNRGEWFTWSSWAQWFQIGTAGMLCTALVVSAILGSADKTKQDTKTKNATDTLLQIGGITSQSAAAAASSAKSSAEAAHGINSLQLKQPHVNIRNIIHLPTAWPGATGRRRRPAD